VADADEGDLVLALAQSLDDGVDAIANDAEHVGDASGGQDIDQNAAMASATASTGTNPGTTRAPSTVARSIFRNPLQSARSASHSL